MIHFYENKTNIRILCGLADLNKRTSIKVFYNISLDREKLNEKRAEFMTKYVQETPDGKTNFLIGQWALSGQLNALSPNRLAEAMEGRTPSLMNLHHVVPLAWGGSNDERNLILVEGRVHYFLHRKIYGAVNNRIQLYLDELNGNPPKPILILLPKLPRVIQSIEETGSLFTPKEKEQFREEGKNPALCRRRFLSAIAATAHRQRDI